jgi:hypothetical protein
MGGVIIEGKVWDGTRGGDMMLWKESSVLITRFINKEKLVGQRLRLYQDKVRIRIPKPFPGIPVPHLHYKGKVYPLTRAQWNRFSKMIVKDLTARISKVRTVDLEGLSTMSTAISVAKGRR